ncbi:hypothetical protein [Jiella sp. M17.18]|uniref:hypothetical protein n=1 Tax=Jiella sp. M17.18 TaxID=3234247 RepID=UPI0034DEFDCF
MGEGKDNVASLMGTKRLADAVRQAKIAAAQRSDVIVDIREADRARLEILAEELQPVIDDLPAGDDFFDFTITGGIHPRLWIDGTANVLMARDRRTYRFVRETRLGRLTLAESTEPRQIADHVTDYVAERIVERERAFAAEDMVEARGVVAPRQKAVKDADAEPLREPERRSKGADFVIALVWLMIGAVLGAGLLLAIASYQGVAVG